MIRKIGLIYQDRHSAGFLRGLCDRLECKATLVVPPAAIGKTQVMPRRQIRLAWKYFQHKGVDLVVRFTDADGSRWEDIQRDEISRVPDDAQSIWICGVAVNNVEEWLCLDVNNLANLLGIEASAIPSGDAQTGTVKRLIFQNSSIDESSDDVVARIVRKTPARVFRRWLQQPSLLSFYKDCRAAAMRAECQTPNDLDSSNNE